MYKRILLKLSGETLQGNGGFGIDKEKTQKIVDEILELKKLGKEIAIVIGAGNYWRYRDMTELNLPRIKSDQLGMLATVFNCSVLADFFERNKIETTIYSSFEIKGIAIQFQSDQAVRDLQNGKILLLAGGTGNPYFTTDSAAALKALELNCNVLLKATKVDGVFDSDPEKDPDAQKFNQLTYQEIIEKNLQVMDLTAVALCRENKMPLLVFNVLEAGNLKKAVQGEKTGTLVLS